VSTLLQFFIAKHIKSVHEGEKNTIQLCWNFFSSSLSTDLSTGLPIQSPRLIIQSLENAKRFSGPGKRRLRGSRWLIMARGIPLLADMPMEEEHEKFKNLPPLIRLYYFLLHHCSTRLDGKLLFLLPTHPTGSPRASC
jgi:hypothetical protein